MINLTGEIYRLYANSTWDGIMLALSDLCRGLDDIVYVIQYAHGCVMSRFVVTLFMVE